MPSFFLALLFTVIASIGGRDQRLVAGLSARLGSSMNLLVVGWIASAVTASTAAGAGFLMARLLPPDAKTMLVAFALLAAGLEMLLLHGRKLPYEPTRSLVAIFLVLVAQQIGDGARFLILVVAISTGNPVLAAIGGAVGGGLALAIGWAGRGETYARLPLRLIRRSVASALIVIGVVIGLYARGILV